MDIKSENTYTPFENSPIILMLLEKAMAGSTAKGN